MLWGNDIKQLFADIMPAARSRFYAFSLTSAKEYMAAWFAAAMGLVLSLVTFWGVQQQLHAHELLEFKWVAQNRHRALYKAIDNSLQAVRSIRDLFLVSEQVPQEDFAAFAQSLLERHPGIHALAWVPRVPAAQRQAFEKSARMAGLDFQIVEKSVGDRALPLPEGPQRDELPLLVHPVDEDALGAVLLLLTR